MMCTTITKAFSAYTFVIANTVRARYFFDFMVKKCKTVTQRNKVKKIKAEFQDESTRASISMLKTLLSPEAFAECLKKSRDKCLKEASKICSQDKELDDCVICLESKANYYLIHGGTAHKSLCSVCAMNLALHPPTFGRPRCPSCRETVWLFLESTSSKLPCVCKQETCKRHLVIVRETFDSCSTYRASVECSTCTLTSCRPLRSMSCFGMSPRNEQE